MMVDLYIVSHFYSALHNSCALSTTVVGLVAGNLASSLYPEFARDPSPWEWMTSRDMSQTSLATQKGGSSNSHVGTTTKIKPSNISCHIPFLMRKYLGKWERGSWTVINKSGIVAGTPWIKAARDSHRLELDVNHFYYQGTPRFCRVNSLRRFSPKMHSPPSSALWLCALTAATHGVSGSLINGPLEIFVA
jgi:hypothetical protein